MQPHNKEVSVKMKFNKPRIKKQKVKRVPLKKIQYVKERFQFPEPLTGVRGF